MIRRQLLKTTVLALLPVALTAMPVAASTLPRVDFQGGKTAVAIGLLDANLDYAFSDRVSLGVSGSLLSPVTGRATVRLGAVPNGGSYGMTFSAGLTPNVWGSVSGPTTYSVWMQPALNVAVPLGSPTSDWTLRGTVGPLLFGMSIAAVPSMLFWPNLELAYRLDGANEVTLGGNGLVGWRGTI